MTRLRSKLVRTTRTKGKKEIYVFDFASPGMQYMGARQRFQGIGFEAERLVAATASQF